MVALAVYPTRKALEAQRRIGERAEALRRAAQVRPLSPEALEREWRRTCAAAARTYADFARRASAAGDELAARYFRDLADNRRRAARGGSQ
jgi:hypothetical protein